MSLPVQAELLGHRWQLYSFDILLGDFHEGRLGDGLRLARRQRNAARCAGRLRRP